MIGTTWTSTGEIEIEVNEDLSYCATVMAEFERDPDYGSDLDGNRGCVQDFLLDLEIQKVVDSRDGKEVKVSKELTQRIYAKAEEECWGWSED